MRRALAILAAAAALAAPAPGQSWRPAARVATPPAQNERVAWSKRSLTMVGPPQTGGMALVPMVADALKPAVKQRLADHDAKVRRQLTAALKFPAMFKLPVRLKCASDPWAGMAALEAIGLRVASDAGGKSNVLPALLDRLCGAAGKPIGQAPPPPPKPPKLDTLDDHVRHIRSVLDTAGKLREESLAKMPAKTRGFMHVWPATIVRTFGPQLPLNAKTRQLCQNDLAFCGLSKVQCDWSKLTASAKVLSALANEAYLASLARACKAAKPIADKPAGVTGDILYSGASPHGLIIIGGAGANTYKLTRPVAMIVDAGGRDEYRGKTGAGFDAAHAISVAIDLSGDDTYDCGPFGLATGRLGVGMLIDCRGDDTYKLAEGSGGVGFAGIGILLDKAGDDTYTGSRFTQAAAVAGIGLLLDLGGNDKHTSFGFAVGFGGPAGVGALIDAAGDDSYQCGGKYPSNYNRTDNPKAKPGDPAFQYRSFGLGAGMGRRILSSRAQDHAYSLAGGMGMLIDLAGRDRGSSSNFSQGCGYFFGVGLRLDLAGDDVHGAARYGHASGAHFGMGLFVDYAGRDTYTSTGPTYNCGCAWDRSAFMFIDGGDADDAYQLSRSSGLGRADINSWGVFAEMGGDDRYTAPGGLGKTSRTGLAVFYDRAGKDDYTKAPASGKFKPADSATHHTADGGLFIDASGAP